MSKHLEKECKLPIELIAKQRQTYLNEARTLFYHLDGKQKADIVAERTILYMDKYRNQTLLEDHITIKKPDMLIRVRARQKGVTGYISAMRPNWLGNPFTLEKYSLEESLVLYREYLEDKLLGDNKFEERFLSIAKGSTIGCSCPLDKPCHVDIIIDVYTNYPWELML